MTDILRAHRPARRSETSTISGWWSRTPRGVRPRSPLTCSIARRLRAPRRTRSCEASRASRKRRQPGVGDSASLSRIMLRPFFATAMRAPVRHLSFRRTVALHVLVLAWSGLAPRRRRPAPATLSTVGQLVLDSRHCRGRGARRLAADADSPRARRSNSCSSPRCSRGACSSPKRWSASAGSRSSASRGCPSCSRWSSAA